MSDARRKDQYEQSHCLLAKHIKMVTMIANCTNNHHNPSTQEQSNGEDEDTSPIKSAETLSRYASAN